MTRFLIDGPETAERTFVFAPGAGGPMVSPFMATVARGIAASGVRVVRFEFPYMAAKKKRPDPQDVLLQAWRDVVQELDNPHGLVIGGKSLGGRMASMVADELRVAGLLCFGYPFHPPGQPAKLRTAHLASLKTPALIIQGTRDPFGTRQEVEGYELSSSIRIEWILEGNHSLKPAARSRVTEKQNVERAISAGVTFITSQR